MDSEFIKGMIGFIIFFVVGTIWVVVGQVAASGFFELGYWFGWLFGIGYVGLTRCGSCEIGKTIAFKGTGTS